MIKIIKGNLLDTDCDVICHQVNCQGVMGVGVARQIKEKYPNVYEKYVDTCDEVDINMSSILLGEIQFVETQDNKIICNMFAQDTHGNNSRCTNYEAFYNCLEEIKKCLVDNTATFAFPYGIGCGLGGGNWNIIFTMIEEVLGDFDVKIYKLD